MEGGGPYEVKEKEGCVWVGEWWVGRSGFVSHTLSQSWRNVNYDADISLVVSEGGKRKSSYLQAAGQLGRQWSRLAGGSAFPGCRGRARACACLWVCVIIRLRQRGWWGECARKCECVLPGRLFGHRAPMTVCGAAQTLSQMPPERTGRSFVAAAQGAARGHTPSTPSPLCSTTCTQTGTHTHTHTFSYVPACSYGLFHV